MPNLASVRSNLNFAVNYENGHLVPTVEVILLVQKPTYTQNKKGDVVKTVGLQELRFDTSLNGVNALIGELQAMLANLNNYDQLAASINHVIKGKQEFDTAAEEKLKPKNQTK
ncbi:MAG: hypothetical protein V4538_17375 [Bacteroidota bacterium]